LNGTDADGWFDTGDLARLDAQGYVRITGRSKDVIIRGGENIPVVEIEALLYRHPAMAMAAVVAYPDERLGERACATACPQRRPERSRNSSCARCCWTARFKSPRCADLREPRPRSVPFL
jgi:non-ribosomal peptide synthetase component E (peptide arylation enzyme)